MTVPSNFVVSSVTDGSTGTMTLSVSGEFDGATVPEFDAVVERSLALDPAAVNLDLTGTVLIDSTAIGAIMRFHETLQRSGTLHAIYAPRPFQQTLFEVTGLFHILDPALLR